VVVNLIQDVRLIPPVGACRPTAGPVGERHVRRNKNDTADAAAICEAVSRPSMRFVADQIGGAASGRWHSREPAPAQAGRARC
jgi:hypothetical protein